MKNQPGSSVKNVLMNTNLRSVQQMALSTFVKAAHRLSIHPRAEAITMFRMFPNHLMLVNWNSYLSFASRPATISTLFIGKSNGSSSTAWLTVSVSWIVVIVQLATVIYDLRIVVALVHNCVKIGIQTHTAQNFAQYWAVYVWILIWHSCSYLVLKLAIFFFCRWYVLYS